jgi:hypothetical protein
LWVEIARGALIPTKLRHRLVTEEGTVEGAVIGTHHTKLATLGAPLSGPGWLASDGPSNDRNNHHRRGVLIVNGHARISRRLQSTGCH